LRRGALELRASLAASDLAKTARSLGPALAPLALRGRGRLELSAEGSLARPKFSARGRFDELGVKGLSARGLALSASLLGQHLAIDARVAGPQPLSLRAAGRVALARGAVALNALELASPEARWRLAAPTRIVVGSDALEVAGFDLRSGAQAVRADVDAAPGRAGRLDGRLEVVALDLARLPRFVQPGGRELGGRLDLTARVTGTRRRPSLTARLALSNARLGAARALGLSVQLQASLARVAGTFSARGLSTSARGRFDVPAAWPPRAAHGPLEIDLDLAPTDLAEASRLLQLPGPSLGGRVALSLRVAGTTWDPSARLEVTAKSLVVADTLLGDPRLVLAGARGAPTRLRVDVQPGSAPRAPQLTGAIELETADSIDQLLRSPPSVAELSRTSFSARGEIHGIPLALGAGALNLGGELRGTAALRLDVKGTTRAPHGALNVTVSGAASDAFPPTDGRLDVALTERDTRVAARLSRQGQAFPLAAMSAVWGAALGRVWGVGLEALASQAPLDLRLYAGPVDVKHATYLPHEAGPTQDLRARARLTAHVTGTLSRPVAEAAAEVSRATVGKQDVGRAVIQLHYADAQARLTANATSGGGGTLRVRASTRADLGWPHGLAALDPPNLPIDAAVEARAFDLAWLVGVSDAVRLVEGKLEANARVGGTLSAPTFAGRIEWKDGAVAVTEIGEYRDVHVALSAGQGRITIEDLRASSRGGTAHVTGRAMRAPQGHLDVSARADLSRFPIYGQGDVLGTLSTRLALRANVSKLGAKGRLEIEEAKGELGEIRRKEVQSLDRPDDVVLVSRGRPVNKEEARRLSELQAKRTTATSVQSAPEGATWTAEADIVAPRNLWVRGEEAQLELGLSDGFKVQTGAATRVFGAVIVRRGTVDVLGRRFTLQKDSKITFAGPPDAPTLDVVARHVNERSKVTVVVSLRGTPEDLRVDVSSPDRPDLNQTQLYGLLVTGQVDVGERAATGSSGISNEAASLVGGLLASTLQKTLRKRLPLDVLTIQAGTGLTGSRLEAGTYIGSRLYVGYVGRVGADPILLQNRNAVRVEYQLTSRWSVDAEYGDVGTGTADVVWNKHY
jgi:translocation and assembly module TamB